MTRRCTECKLTLSIDYFYGCRKVCKKCRNDARKESCATLGYEYIRCSVWDAKKRCNKNGRAIDKDLVEHLCENGGVPTKCPILGIELRYRGGDNSPSLDRIDSTLGYIKGNVQYISKRANTIKSNATVEEIGLLYKFLTKEVIDDS